ncbi:MAG TPA: FlgD immunoglobulin-like domain containing protein, partial [Candidatus Udaeobacter sp.]|nr:FlgD immunoglobulin-like domain containing protein [Candidatus Udaeobacter sp.]
TPRETVSQVMFGIPTVVAALGALTDQPLLFTSFDGQGDQIKFQLDDLAAASFYCFQADVVVTETQTNPDGVLTFYFDALPGGVRTVFFEPDGEIRARIGADPSDLIGTSTLGTAVHLQVEIDLVNDLWVISLDGEEVWADSFGAVNSLAALRVSTPVTASPAHLTAAIDNLTINDGICDPKPCLRLAFDEVTAGATYAVGSSFASEDVIIAVEPLHPTPGPCGGASVNGTAVVGNSANACRTGNEIHADDVTLDFDFGGTIDDVVIYYGDNGGTVSLGLNGDCRTVQNFPQLDGTVQGAVAIEVVDSGAAGGCGVIRLLGEIDQLTIGGQDLWIDAVSYCHVCSDVLRSAFQDQTLGTTYGVGDAFTSGAATYRVEPFFAPGPTCTGLVAGGVRIQNGGLACSNGNELEIHDANVGIDFGTTVDRMVLSYGEYGGNVNLTINGDCRNVDNFNILNATDVGDVRVIVGDFDQSGNSCGMMYLVGPIEQLRIGGHDLLIDNLRACGLVVTGIQDPILVPGAGAALLELEQNQPNPFNPATTIAFTLASPMRARLTIYDVTGRAVRTLSDGMLGSGRHEVQWDGTDARGGRVASGLYVYRLEAGGMASTRRMVILK